jgi:FKBP-type peptidyl-prolyl cis-trans isomerase
MTSIRLRRAALGALCILGGCAPAAAFVTTGSGLRYTVVAPGSGAPARPGQSVLIHETTTLASGTVIFSSREKDTPVPFVLGANHVIAGVDEGVTGMRVGERRRLIIPPALSRRSSYPPNTPPDSTLYIDVELVSISNPR